MGAGDVLGYVAVDFPDNVRQLLYGLMKSAIGPGRQFATLGVPDDVALVFSPVVEKVLNQAICPIISTINLLEFGTYYF